MSSIVARRLRRGGAAASLFRLATVATNLAAVALLARLLEPAYFGLYLLAYAVVTLGAALALGGSEHAAVRFVATSLAAQDPSGALAVIRRTRVIALAGIALTSALLLSVREPLFSDLLAAPDLASNAWLLALWIAFQAYGTFQAGALRGAHELVRSAGLYGFWRAFAFFLAIAAVSRVQPLSLELALACAVLASLVNVAVGAAALRGWWTRHHPGVKPASTAPTELWLESWPIMLSTVLGIIVLQADLWLVGALGTKDELALYGAVTKLMVLATLPLVIVNATVSSTIAELHAVGERATLQRILRTSATLAGLVTAGLVLVFTTGGGPLLGGVFGEFYRAGAVLLAILSVGRFASVWSGSCGIALIMSGYQREQLLVTAVSAVVFLLAGAWAGSRWGAIGIACATSAAMVLNNVAMLALVHRRLGVWTHMYMSPRRMLESLKYLQTRGALAPDAAVR